MRGKKKDQISALLKSIETGEISAVAVVNDTVDVIAPRHEWNNNNGKF